MTALNSSSQWDVIVLGGALSGASTATLILRRNPRARVLILERSELFTRRVGESTVETSTFFLGRTLDLTNHLNEKHLAKQGMRFWFHNGQTKTLADCSETGPGYNVRFPSYQVDRAVLDQEVLDRVVAAGATLFRPVRIKDVVLVAGGQQSVTWENAQGASETAQARWVVDASGVAAILARKNGWYQTNTAHPIAACWSRWRGVKSWDCRELRERFPAWGLRAKGVRFTATNHIVGKGWWSWWIPLRGGDVSVGIVYDQRLVELPEGARLGDRLKDFLLQHPAAKELLTDASYVEGDVHFRRNCAYRSTKLAGDGFVLVGDAGAFMDPFYSPGMDWIGFTATSAAALVGSCLSGRAAADRVARYDERFRYAYDKWFDAIYRDKYYYMGDHELMTLAFRLDLGCYYIGVVSQPFKYGEVALETPPFAEGGAEVPARFMAFYNRRLATIARGRMERGTWGQSNHGRFYSFISYQLDRRLPWRLSWAALTWGMLELREGWRTWFRSPVLASEAPVRRPAPGTDAPVVAPLSARA